MTEENKETKPEQEKPKEESGQKTAEKKEDDNVIYIGSKPFKTCQSRLCVEV